MFSLEKENKMIGIKKIICLLTAIYVTNITLINMLGEIYPDIFPKTHRLWIKMKNLDNDVNKIFNY